MIQHEGYDDTEIRSDFINTYSFIHSLVPSWIQNNRFDVNGQHQTIYFYIYGTDSSIWCTQTSLMQGILKYISISSNIRYYCIVIIIYELFHKIKYHALPS